MKAFGVENEILYKPRDFIEIIVFDINLKK